MAQDILSVSIADFEKRIHRISSPNLKNLIRGIYETKWENGWRMSDEQIMDMERKQTKIEAELQRRGYLTKKDLTEYYTWLRQINFKKRLY